MSGSALRKCAPWVALAMALGFLAFYADKIERWMLDDAFISFRYAENFADGKGLVYNEGERVEGYTTFLWVVAMAAAHKVGFDTVVASRWLGALFAIATLVLLSCAHRLWRKLDGVVTGMALLLVSSSAVFSSWTLSGMEVMLVCFLGLLTALIYLRAREEESTRLYAAAGVLCALAAMTRPDAGLLFVAFGGDRLLARWRRGRPGWLPLGLGLLSVYGPYFLWRYLYYGWLLPNTFYAKVGSTWAQVSRGLDYFTRFSGASLLIVAAAAVGLMAAPALKRRFGPSVVLGAYLLLHVFYVIAVGGDSQPSYRFFAEVMPLLCLWAAMTVRSLDVPRAAQALFLVLAVLLNVYQAFHETYILRFVAADRVAERGELAGRWLRENSPPDAVVATNTAGSIPYYSRLRAIDMLGLNDSHIAHREIEGMGTGIAGHEKGDGDYIVERRPTYIVFDSATGSRKPRRPSDEQIWKNEDFHRLYKFHTFRVGNGRSFNVYILDPEAGAAADAGP